MMKSQLFKGERIKTPTERKPLLRILRPNLDPKDTLAITEAIQGPGTTQTETGNTVSTANCRTTRRMSASKEFEKRNRAEIDMEEPTGLECT
jgi:hypothetical protein